MVFQVGVTRASVSTAEFSVVAASPVDAERIAVDDATLYDFHKNGDESFSVDYVAPVLFDGTTGEPLTKDIPLLQRVISCALDDRKVTLEFAGDGSAGWYDPSKPDDTPYLRLTIEERTGAWKPRFHGATHIVATISPSAAFEIVSRILDFFHGFRSLHAFKDLELLKWVRGAEDLGALVATTSDGLTLTRLISEV